MNNIVCWIKFSAKGKAKIRFNDKGEPQEIIDLIDVDDIDDFEVIDKIY